jgi:hypothetical protein
LSDERGRIAEREVEDGKTTHPLAVMREEISATYAFQ